MIRKTLYLLKKNSTIGKAIFQWNSSSKTLGCDLVSRTFCTNNFDEKPYSQLGHKPTVTPQGVPGTLSSGEKMVMVFTCTVCNTRSAKTISKHAYQKGVVLARCPGCENLHLIADRLGWFEDDSYDVEQILKQRGENVKVVTDDNVLELTESDIIGNNFNK